MSFGKKTLIIESDIVKTFPIEKTSFSKKIVFFCIDN